MLVTLSLIPTLAMVGLVVDIGYAYYRKIMAQTAAQSAAIGAAMAVKSKVSACNANGLTCTTTASACAASPVLSASDNYTNGCLYAKQNGFVNSGRQTVTMWGNLSSKVASPVGSGPTPTYWVSATVSEQIPSLFSVVMGNSLATVNARATSGVFTPPANACIYALEPTGTGFSVGGTVTINSGCGIYVNSSSSGSPYAMTGGGGSVITASEVDVVGVYNANGGTSLTCSGGGTCPNQGVSSTADPLKSVPAPNPSHTSCDDSGGGLTQNSNITMPADGFFIVCNGFSMNSNGNLTLPSGTYIMKGGSIDWKNGTLNGTNVTFYLTGTFNSISVNGNMITNLQAPTSSSNPLHGLLFFEDRTLGANAVSVTFNGGSGLVLNGALYFPQSLVKYSGGSTTTNNHVALIASSINFIGNSYFVADIGGQWTDVGSPYAAVIE
ncbi:MAG TPA: pilus assembly protein TadG-related protein [Bryobacteraceae bacterium]